MAHAGGRPRKQVTVEQAAEKQYYTVQEAAALTKTHIHTIQARLRDGTLQGKKLGGVWRIYPDSLVNVKVGADLNIETNTERR